MPIYSQGVRTEGKRTLVQMHLLTPPSPQSPPLFHFFSTYYLECPNRGIDLAFVLDSSGSVGETNFRLERDFVSNIVLRFEVGPEATQVAVISYSGFAVVNFQLNNFTTQEDVLQAVSEVKYFDIEGEWRKGGTTEREKGGGRE